MRSIQRIHTYMSMHKHAALTIILRRYSILFGDLIGRGHDVHGMIGMVVFMDRDNN